MIILENTHRLTTMVSQKIPQYAQKLIEFYTQLAPLIIKYNGYPTDSELHAENIDVDEVREMFIDVNSYMRKGQIDKKDVNVLNDLYESSRKVNALLNEFVIDEHEKD